MKHIVYYKTGLDTEYEMNLLKEWGVSEKITIINIEEDSNIDLVNSANDLLAEGLLIVYQQVTREIIQAVPSLKIISIPSIGYNNIDVIAAKDNNVLVTNVPGYCIEEVALHAICMAMDLARKLTFLDRDVRNGNWNFDYGYSIYRMSGKYFGMVFFGAIPKYMIPVLKAMKMHILVYAPTKSSKYIEAYGCEKVADLNELLEKSDFISVHTPLNEGTRRMFGREEFSRMKKTAFFINTARGQAVDESALVEALKNNKICGAAVDVIEREDERATELSKLPNAIVTPHSAFLSVESLLEARTRALKHMVDLLIFDKMPDNIVT